VRGSGPPPPTQCQNTQTNQKNKKKKKNTARRTEHQPIQFSVKKLKKKKKKLLVNPAMPGTHAGGETCKRYPRGLHNRVYSRYRQTLAPFIQLREWVISTRPRPQELRHALRNWGHRNLVKSCPNLSR